MDGNRNKKRSRRSSRKCEICGAKDRSSTGGSSLFAQFPLDENRCKAWLKAVGNEELVHVPIEKLHQLRFVCENHFRKKDFNKRGNRLKKRAIPMSNLAAVQLTDAQLVGFPQHMWSPRNDEDNFTVNTSEEQEACTESPPITSEPDVNTETTSEEQGTCTEPPTTSKPDFSKSDVLTVAVCRTCALMTELVIPIFQGEGLRNCLADKIHKYLPIQVSEQDSLSVVVCYQCASTLLAWHELVECCVQADHALRTSLAAHEADKQQEARPGTSTTTGETQLQLLDEEKSNTYDFTSTIQKVLRNHFQMEEIDTNYKFNCLECGNTTVDDAIQLARHLKSQHEINFEDTARAFIENNVMCEEILLPDQESAKGSVTSDDEDASSVKKLETKLQNYFCPFCSKIFASTSRLIFHLNSHGELHSEGSYDCTICEFKTNSRKQFAVHLQTSHVERTLEDLELTCRSCGHTACDSEELEVHIKTVHCVEEPKKKYTPIYGKKKIPAECPLCKKSFSNTYIMQNHLKLHFTQQRYTCRKCPKSYRSELGRRRHAELVHEGILRFVCKNCGETFATKQHLDTHVRKHTGAKPQVCRLCNKGFRDKSDLKRHMEMHLDVRNYACHVCPKRFRKVSHLKTHLRSHEDKKEKALKAG